jgi:glycosyltransferase involved in cell wall biosynthesis
VLEEYKAQYNAMLSRVSAIISVSDDMTNQLLKLGAEKNRIYKIPYGVDIELFSKTHPEKNGKILIFVGRFTEKKAPDLLLKAFQVVCEKLPDARLIMIGKGELYGLVMKTISNLHLDASVEVLGWQGPDVIADYMKTARAYVQHSLTAANGDSEGTPNSILEASACGLPIVSTYHAGIKEAVIHGVTGLLVEESDWKTMGEYMIELLDNPAKAGEMGNSAREHITRNYSLKTQAGKLQDVLSKLVIPHD